MPSWHERLQAALDARGKTWADLVKITGLNASSVYAWQPGATRRSKMMGADNAAIVCAWLRINIDWLFLGSGSSGLGLDDPYPTTRFEPTMDEIDTVLNLRKIPPGEVRVLSMIIAKLAKHGFRDVQE